MPAEIPFLGTNSCREGIGCRVFVGVQRRDGESERDGDGELAGTGHGENDPGNRGRGLVQPLDETVAFGFPQLQEARDSIRMRGPLQQRGDVHRAAVGVLDPEPGCGQPVKRGGFGEHRAGEAPPAARWLGVQQCLGHPTAIAPGQCRVQASSTERVRN